MKIIKSRFAITKLPPGKVVRQSDVDVAAEKSFVKKFGDRPAYMGYGMEGSGSLAARDYAEKVANRVYFKKLKSELSKTRKITATGVKALKASGIPLTKNKFKINKGIPVKQSKSYKSTSKYLPASLNIGKARGAMKADIIARTEADLAMDRIMERYTSKKGQQIKSRNIKYYQKPGDPAPAAQRREIEYVSQMRSDMGFEPNQPKVKYKKPKVKTTKSNFQTEFKSYISKEFKL